VKIRWLLLLAFILSACASVLSDNFPEGGDEGPEPTESRVMEEPASTVLIETEASAATEEPIETQEPIETEPPQTEPPELACATLLNPEKGVELPAVGKVTFSWEPVADASLYILKFTLPTKGIVEFETDEVTKDR